MHILLSKEEIEKITQLWCLKREFEELFEYKVDMDLYYAAHDSLFKYVKKATSENEQEYLENFVKSYFKMEREIVGDRNALIDIITADAFKQISFINKIRYKKQLKKAQNLCDSVNEFEKDFYDKLNISLLRVENERCAREKGQEMLNV